MNRRDVIISSGWLLGYGLTSASLSTLFLSCQAEAKLDWQPVFLSKNQAATLAEVTETILPKFRGDVAEPILSTSKTCIFFTSKISHEQTQKNTKIHSK